MPNRIHPIHAQSNLTRTKAFRPGGVWTRERTAQALLLIAQMHQEKPHHTQSYLRHLAEKISAPAWVTATCEQTRKWIEDDAHPPDAESITEAAKRLFDLDIKNDSIVKRADTFDDGDSFYSLIVSDPILVLITSPNGSEIHVLDPEVISYWDAIRPAEIFLQEFELRTP